MVDPHTQFPESPRASPTNGLGIAGFIVSLVGLLLTCGLLSPIGLILSLVGLRREPRGLAIAGTVIGGFGSLLCVFYGFAMVLSIVGLGTAAEMAADHATTMERLGDAREILDARKMQGGLPPAEEGNRLIMGLQDAWGQPLRYEPSGADYVVRSAGPDGAFDTDDDVTTTTTETSEGLR